MIIIIKSKYVIVNKQKWGKKNMKCTLIVAPPDSGRCNNKVVRLSCHSQLQCLW